MNGNRQARGRAAADRREELMDATIDLVARRGLRELTLRAVAAEVGVSHPLVAHHFGSRDGLIEAAFQHSIARTESIATPRSPTGRVEDFAAGSERIADEEPALQAFQYTMILESIGKPQFRPQVQELYRQWQELTRQALAEIGLDQAETYAAVIFAALDGLTFQQLTVGSRAQTEQALAALRAMLAVVIAHQDELTAPSPRSPGNRRDPHVNDEAISPQRHSV